MPGQPPTQSPQLKTVTRQNMLKIRGPLLVTALSVAIFAAPSFFAAAAAPTRSAPNPVERRHLRPQFTKGQILRYQISTITTTTSNTTTPIANSEGASQLKQTLLMQLRIDVLSVDPGANGAQATVRLRATYEKASATSETDAYDPDAATLVDQFNNLQGRAVEFTIDADGKLSHVAGLDRLLANPIAANTVRSSMSGLSASSQFPREGIVIGQKWNNERPLENSPLANLIWRTESTYVRDESVAQPKSADTNDAADPVAATDGNAASTTATSAKPTTPPSNIECAIIVTKVEILHHGPAHGDSTPPDYVHNGLRTSGTWTGSGDSLDSISLATGFVVRSTQTTKQDMDFEIASPSAGSKIHYVGHVETQTEIKLLP
jgi:hypothetical protein